MDIVSVVPVVNVARLHTNMIDFIVAVVVVVVVVDVSRQAITKDHQPAVQPVSRSDSDNVYDDAFVSSYYRIIVVNNSRDT